MRTYTRRRTDHKVIEDVENLCRLCLGKPDESIQLFDDNSGDVCDPIVLRIMICIGLELKKEDFLPNVICLKCFRELDDYYAFKKKCELSNQRLKSHLIAVRAQNCVIKTENAKENKVKKEELIKKDSTSVMFQVNFDGTIRLCEETPSGAKRKSEPVITLQKIEDYNRSLKQLNGCKTVKHNIETQNGPIFGQKSGENVLKSEICFSNQASKQVVDSNEDSDENKLIINSIESGHNNEPQKQIDSSDTEVSKYVLSLLVELGIVGRQGDDLCIFDAHQSIELQCADESLYTLELVEEDEQEEQSMINQELDANKDIVFQFVNSESESECQSKQEKKRKRATDKT